MVRFCLISSLCLASFCGTARAAEDYPPFAKVIEGFTKVEAPAEDGRTMYDMYVNNVDGQLILEIPKNYADKKYFIGLTVASGQIFAGLQAGDFYVQWRQYNKRMALLSPNVDIRSNGDNESKDSVKRLFTAQVLLDLPILAISPKGGFLIDGDQLLVSNASVFFGSAGRSKNPGLAKMVKHKAFPQNIELAFELPDASGTLQTLYYSISEIPASTGYAPRVADQRIGYFTTSYSDYGKYKEDEVAMNFINRWHLQKRDPSLKVSPPVEPIRFYIEHSTPVRYRRWVKQGIEFWNQAFEKIGISDAIEVVYQDKTTGANMDKDPEDVRYNFVRWLNNNQGTAIGPSRVHPETGQILDADIILTDGWIRNYNDEFADYMPLLAMEGMGPETEAWLAEHPNWDPRVRFANPSERTRIASELRSSLYQANGGQLDVQRHTPLMGDDIQDGLVGRTSQVNGLCLAAEGGRMDTAVIRMLLDIGAENILDDEAEKDKDKEKEKEDEDKDKEKENDKKGESSVAKSDDKKSDDKKSDDKKPEVDSDSKKTESAKKDEPKKPSETMLDGMPEQFVGPRLAVLVAHEVGHTLGLRHNFKASSIYQLKEINSHEILGKKSFAGSVMDYLPLNLRLVDGEVQGDYGMLTLGPYDFWAIEYGYTFEKDLKPILARVSEPELQFATDEDTTGPDPLARRYDFSEDPLDYAREQSVLIERFRKKIISDYVKEGDSWTKARKGYELTLSLQMKNISMMANWIGGAFVNRDKKGDRNERMPLQVVPAKQQREALKFVVESTFRDDSYALSPELLQRLMKDFMERRSRDPAWPVHDRILSIQASALTSLMNSTVLGRVYDNEFRVPEKEDALTLPELLDSVSNEIWSELGMKLEKQFTARQPAISSLRRNLQREHLERLIDLTMPTNGTSAAYKAISNLCMMELTDLKSEISKCLKNGSSLDPYSRAHLSEAEQRITKALDANYVYNQPQSFVQSFPFIFGQTTAQTPAQVKDQPAVQPSEPVLPVEPVQP